MNKLFKDDRPLDILTIPTHEGYQSLLAETGHNFYMMTGPGLKGWDFHTRNLPKNHYIYQLPYNKIRGSERFDLVLCQSRIQQWDILKAVADNFDLPIIVLDHTEPPPGIQPKDFQTLLTRSGDLNVFITEHNKRSWGNLAGQVIPHGIDTHTFGKTAPTRELSKGISVVNHFAQRDVFCGWTLWNTIVERVAVDLVGENPGQSESINDPTELNRVLGSYRFFLNTSQHSPVPLSMLEAMAVGLPIVTTAKQEIPNIIVHGENGFMSNDPEELIKYCGLLINDKDMADEIGNKARQTILDRFSIEQFTTNWNNIFSEVIS